MVVYALLNTLENAFYRIFFWFGEAFVVVFAYVEPQKVKTLIDVRYQCFLRGKFQAPFRKKLAIIGEMIPP